MAAINLYLNDALVNSWQQLTEETQAAATTAGWIVSTGTTNRSKWQSGTGSGTERAATTFDATTYPNGTIDTTLFDCFRSQNAYSGDFAAANWTVTGAMRAVTNGGSQTGVLHLRLFKANSDGSSATEITSAIQSSATSGTIGTGADTEVTVTFNPGAFSITNQYLFFQIAWGRVAAGGMTTADVHFRTGQSTTVGTRIVTSDFTVSLTPTRGRVSWAELEVPFLATRGRISWAELEVPFVATRGRISWAEFEVPLAPTRGRMSWAELEVPFAPADPTRGRVSWAEFEVPGAPTRGRISWAEFQVPAVGGDGHPGGVYQVVMRRRRRQ